jgi:hypothetical protein
MNQMPARAMTKNTAAGSTTATFTVAIVCCSALHHVIEAKQVRRMWHTPFLQGNGGVHSSPRWRRRGTHVKEVLPTSEQNDRCTTVRVLRKIDMRVTLSNRNGGTKAAERRPWCCGSEIVDVLRQRSGLARTTRGFSGADHSEASNCDGSDGRHERDRGTRGEKICTPGIMTGIKSDSAKSTCASGAGSVCVGTDSCCRMVVTSMGMRYDGDSNRCWAPSCGRLHIVTNRIVMKPTNTMNIAAQHETARMRESSVMLAYIRSITYIARCGVDSHGLVGKTASIMKR